MNTSVEKHSEGNCYLKISFFNLETFEVDTENFENKNLQKSVENFKKVLHVLDQAKTFKHTRNYSLSFNTLVHSTSILLDLEHFENGSVFDWSRLIPLMTSQAIQICPLDYS